MKVTIVKMLESFRIFPEGSIVAIQEDREGKVSAFSLDEGVDGYMISSDDRSIFDLMMVELSEDSLLEYLFGDSEEDLARAGISTEDTSRESVIRKIEEAFLIFELGAMGKAMKTDHPLYGVYETTEDMMTDGEIIPKGSEFIARLSGPSFEVEANVWITPLGGDKTLRAEMSVESLLEFRSSILRIPEAFLKAIEKESFEGS